MNGTHTKTNNVEFAFLILTTSIEFIYFWVLKLDFSIYQPHHDLLQFNPTKFCFEVLNSKLQYLDKIK